MTPAVCTICGDLAAGGDLCPPCAGLLRWFRGYFAPHPEIARRVVPHADFNDDLGVDSLDFTEWLLEAEEKLDIAIDDHRVGQPQTVGGFVRMLKEAGARWPESRDIRIRRRRHWWRHEGWEVVERPLPSPGSAE